MNLDFYFNEWAFLAKTDPAVFERRREQTIAEFLSQAGIHRQRLELLQSQVDRAREVAATPQQAVVAISGLMCESLAELAGEMASLTADLKNLRGHAMLRSLARGSKVAADATTDVPSSKGPSSNVPPGAGDLAFHGDGQGHRR
ncbi:MAG: DUF3135 domain-containing protein [Rhodocyclaceae bacterium]|nr:DUF3135 domain-containing protein [Rhodocyclaceae bacterium]